MSLNNEQRKAVEATEGRVLILAGAGSGKTTVLIQRIVHLIKNLGVSPQAILGLTFTNKAAAEMKKRLGEFVNAKEVTLCTFHSFCMKVLRKEIHRLGYTRDFSLYNEQEVRRLSQQIARHLLEHDGDLPSLEPTLAKISHAKNRGVMDTKDKFTSDLFERLHTCLRAYNAVDFDSLLTLTVELFEKHPEVLNTYQEKYRYIMIDEYQDTNPIQYKLAALLSGKHHNLCVVGDDDQSIYGWRGAEIKNILNFESKTVVKLEQNFRSTPTILQAANALIAHNQERHNKQLWSNKDKGDQINLFHAPTDLEEAQAVIHRIIALKKSKNLGWRDFVILYRSNILSRLFEQALMQTAWERDGTWFRGIPYQIFGGTEFFERSEIKDLMAYLKTIANPLDQEAMLRIINTPRRGISDNTLDILTQYNRSKNIPLWDVLKQSDHLELTDKAKNGIKAFVTLIETAQHKFKERPLHTAFQWLVDAINYRKAIQEEVKSDKMREFKMENVAQCIQTLAEYENTTPEDEISLQDFLGNTLLDEERWQKNEKNFSQDKVTLMTFHSAKGLEFTACYLVGLEDHLIPHEKSALDGNLEEERRLFYVAMTRAKKYLTLSMARNRKRMGKDAKSNPSRFLFEIPQDLLKVTSWQTLE